MYKYFDACGRTLGSDLRSNAGGADRAVRQCPAVDCHALYFRAQLVVTTVQPNMNKRRSRAAPQTQCATPLCTTTQRFAMRRSPRQRKGRLEQSWRPSFASVLTTQGVLGDHSAPNDVSGFGVPALGV